MNDCGPGCTYIGCTHLPMEDIADNFEEYSDSDRESTTSSTELNCDVHKIMHKQCEFESSKTHSKRSIISTDEDTM